MVELSKLKVNLKLLVQLLHCQLIMLFLRNSQEASEERASRWRSRRWTSQRWCGPSRSCPPGSKQPVLRELTCNESTPPSNLQLRSTRPQISQLSDNTSEVKPKHGQANKPIKHQVWKMSGLASKLQDPIDGSNQQTYKLFYFLNSICDPWTSPIHDLTSSWWDSLCLLWEKSNLIRDYGT